MTETPDQQPRIPGVRYRKVTLERDETTVIDGIPSTRTVPFVTYEPVPPRDWDQVILHGVTAVTIGITALAVVATTASVGGLLTNLIHPVAAYAAGVVFTLNWLACMAVEWLQRGDARVWIPRTAGWIALVISMGAVGTYGHTLNQLPAGVIGACIDLLAKGLWTLVMGLYRVPLDEGVRHWLSDQEQRLAGKALLAIRLRRLNTQAAYMRAVGGREMDAADAMLTAAAQVREVAAAPTAARETEQAEEPATAPAPAPAAQSAPPVTPVPAPTPAPVVPQAQPAPQPTAPVPPVQPAQAQLLSIAAATRQVLADQGEGISDQDLIDAVAALVGTERAKSLKFPETVLRNRRAKDKFRKPQARQAP
ncbi:hypothetical protein ABZ499_32975 [Streptomyces sp. NPDC019990]|uniref:hypothetical protein n=1 Tax=Streptomyces sp. NPDC019990 TaxID=3154693 RepID=UPI0033D43458